MLFSMMLYPYSMIYVQSFDINNSLRDTVDIFPKAARMESFERQCITMTA